MSHIEYRGGLTRLLVDWIKGWYEQSEISPNRKRPFCAADHIVLTIPAYVALRWRTGFAVEDIMSAYTESWKLGLKAVAIYRDNS